MEKLYFERFKNGWIRLYGKCYEIDKLSTSGILTCYLLNKQGQHENSDLTTFDLNEVPLFEVCQINKQPNWIE